MTRTLIAAGAVVAIVAATVTLARSSPPSHRVRVVQHVVTPRPAIPPSPELTTTTTTVAPPVTTTTVPSPPPQPPAAPGAPGTYTVRAGDTLASIAAGHGLDWPGVCRANRLADCSLIYPGQVLELRSVPAPGPASPPASSDIPGKTFTGNVTPPPAQPSASICDAAVPYLQAHAAPGYSVTCAPGASEPVCAERGIPGAVGCTVSAGPGNGGSIYIDSNCHSMVPAENEAANSQVFNGTSTGPIDPNGGARC